jgi:hypothetical protein
MTGIVAAPTFHLRSADGVYAQPDCRGVHHRGRALKALMAQRTTPA